MNKIHKWKSFTNHRIIKSSIWSWCTCHTNNVNWELLLFIVQIDYQFLFPSSSVVYAKWLNKFDCMTFWVLIHEYNVQIDVWKEMIEL